MIYRTLLSTLLLLFLGVAQRGRALDEHQAAILKTLMTNYDKGAFPPKGEGEPVNVDISMHLLDFYFDGNQKATWQAYFRMSWTDERLTFNQSDEGMNFNEEAEIWIPDIFIANALEVRVEKFVKPNTLKRITSKGRVLVSHRLTFTTKCRRDFWNFPGDTISCPAKIESFSYTTSDISLEENGSKKRSLFVFDENVWSLLVGYQILGSQVTTNTIRTSTGNYSGLTVNLGFKRMMGNYLAAWHMPCIMLVVVAFFCLLLGPESTTNRILLTLIPLVTLSLLSFHIKSSSPPSESPTAMDKFTGISILTIFLLLVQTLVEFLLKEKTHKEKMADDDNEIDSEKKNNESKLKRSASFLPRYCLVGFYALFLIIYFSLHA